MGVVLMYLNFSFNICQVADSIVRPNSSAESGHIF